MLSLPIIKFHVIHLNPASCKCCNILPQTLLLETAMGILHFQKNLPGQTGGQISFATGEITLVAQGNVRFFRLLQSRRECVPVRKFGNV